MKALKLKIAGGTAALAAVIGGGAAVAANQLSPTEESDAIVADAAKQLGVSADKLDAALKQALENRVDAALEAGTITAAQAAELKQRIDAGEVPLVGVGPGFGHRGGHHGFVDFAARSRLPRRHRGEAPTPSLENGDTLAEIAKANGKTAAGLEQALVAAAKADLDAEGRGRPADGGPADGDPRRPRVAHRRRRQRRVRVRLPRRARRHLRRASSRAGPDA